MMLIKLLNIGFSSERKLLRNSNVLSESTFGLAIIAFTSPLIITWDMIERLSDHISSASVSTAILYAASAYGLEYVTLSVTY